MQTTPAPQTLGALLAAAAQRLDAVTDTPRLDAELLLAHALGTTRARLLTRLPDAVRVPGLDALLARRLDHEPIAYITGAWEFFSLDFLTRAPVLVPRPETEHLVETALRHLGARPASRVLDLCTGTGCVAISIAKNCPGACVDAVDLQPHAIALARENTARHSANVAVFQGDLFAALADPSVKYDVIVSNPPYISPEEYAQLPPVILKHEDPVALLAGDQGLDIVRRILLEAPAWLAPGGLLALEIGDTQAGAARALAQDTGWRDIAFVHDLAGHARIFTARH